MLDLTTTTLSAETLATLDDFEDCVATLGAIESWSSDQLDALGALATDVRDRIYAPVLWCS